MSRSPSRLEREDHPPMSRALRKLMTITGTSGMDLARQLEMSQSAVSRYYNDREPDYPVTRRIEEAMAVPPGTLFSLAGYCPPAQNDALTAILNDETLTDGQKFSLLFPLLESLRSSARAAAPVDSLSAVLADERVPMQRRRVLAEMVQQYRAENEEKAAQRAPRKRTTASVHSRHSRSRG